MNILYCGDRNITEGIVLSVLSIKEYTDQPLCIYVLTVHGQIHDQSAQPVDKKRLMQLDSHLKKSNPGSFVRIIDITSLFLRDLPGENLSTRFTPFCMLRLYADEIEEIPDKILYLDTDVMAHGDPMTLYSVNLEGKEMAGVLDQYGKWFFHQHPFHFDYLNSGVLLLNMKQIRKSGLFKNARKMCMEKEMFMPDQSALNKLKQDVIIVPERFNEQDKQEEDTVFRHFTTVFRFWPFFHLVSVKPWQQEQVHNTLNLHTYDFLYQEAACMK